MKLIFLNLIILSILSVSCTKEVKYYKEEMNDILLAADSRVEFILGHDFEGNYPTHADYIGDSVHIFGMKLGMLYFISVEYASEEGARKAAQKYNGYYLKNWFFDDVKGEPALEELMLRIKAKKP